MPGEYADQSAYIDKVRPQVEARRRDTRRAIEQALGSRLVSRQTQFVRFAGMSVDELAQTITQTPQLVKVLMLLSSTSPRSVFRDLGLTISAYRPAKLLLSDAKRLAKYCIPSLPAEIALEAVVELDAAEFLDKEIRAYKGRWENRLALALAVSTGMTWKKRKFFSAREQFELDIAHPDTGTIEIGIDVKRIESPRDIHKRTDEIINKASHFSRVFPDGRFAAIIYYPFDHQQVISRIGEAHQIFWFGFAGETDESIEAGIGGLVTALGLGPLP